MPIDDGVRAIVLMNYKKDEINMLEVAQSQDLGGLLLYYQKLIWQSQMSTKSIKKYSKISPALKCYFLENLYYHCLSIRESAQKCRINYSTAKIILRDLTPDENKFVKKLLLKKQRDEKDGNPTPAVCSYCCIRHEEKIEPTKVEVVSRVDWDFFGGSMQVKE